MDTHAVRRHDADGLTVEMLAGGDQPARDDAVTQDLLVAVDVVEVGLEGLDALGDATLQPRPLGGRDDSRDLVQRKRPLLTGQRERDALVDKGPAQRLGAVVEVGGILRRQLSVDALIGSADVALSVEHLVESFRVATTRGVIAVKDLFIERLRLAALLPFGFSRQGSKGHCAMLHQIVQLRRSGVFALGNASGTDTLSSRRSSVRTLRQTVT